MASPLREKRTWPPREDAESAKFRRLRGDRGRRQRDRRQVWRGSRLGEGGLKRPSALARGTARRGAGRPRAARTLVAAPARKTGGPRKTRACEAPPPACARACDTRGRECRFCCPRLRSFTVLALRWQGRCLLRLFAQHDLEVGDRVRRPASQRPRGIRQRLAKKRPLHRSPPRRARLQAPQGARRRRRVPRSPRNPGRLRDRQEAHLPPQALRSRQSPARSRVLPVTRFGGDFLGRDQIGSDCARRWRSS